MLFFQSRYKGHLHKEVCNCFPSSEEAQSLWYLILNRWKETKTRRANLPMLNSIFFVVSILLVTAFPVMALLGKYTWALKWPLLTVSIAPVSPIRILWCVGFNLVLVLQLTGLGSKLILPPIDWGTIPQLVKTSGSTAMHTNAPHSQPAAPVAPPPAVNSNPAPTAPAAPVAAPPTATPPPVTGPSVTTGPSAPTPQSAPQHRRTTPGQRLRWPETGGIPPK